MTRFILGNLGLPIKGILNLKQSSRGRRYYFIYGNAQYGTPGNDARITGGKIQNSAKSSLANYSFMIGGTNDNLEELLKKDRRNVAGIKLFLGSSTGNMLVDDEKVLEKIFSSTNCLSLFIARTKQP